MEEFKKVSIGTDSEARSAHIGTHVRAYIGFYVHNFSSRNPYKSYVYLIGTRNVDKVYMTLFFVSVPMSEAFLTHFTKKFNVELYYLQK